MAVRVRVPLRAHYRQSPSITGMYSWRLYRFFRPSAPACHRHTASRSIYAEAGTYARSRPERTHPALTGARRSHEKGHILADLPFHYIYLKIIFYVFGKTRKKMHPPLRALRRAERHRRLAGCAAPLFISVRGHQFSSSIEDHILLSQPFLSESCTLPLFEASTSKLLAAIIPSTSIVATNTRGVLYVFFITRFLY